MKGATPGKSKSGKCGLTRDEQKEKEFKETDFVDDYQHYHKFWGKIPPWLLYKSIDIELSVGFLKHGWSKMYREAQPYHFTLDSGSNKKEICEPGP
jgi:hypothetical protein